MGGVKSGVMCCEFREAWKVEWIFSIFLWKTPQVCLPKAEGDLSMGASWLVVCVTHRLGLTIIFVGCGDCPEFLL